MKELIYRRKSWRSYSAQPVGEDILAKLRALELKPLDETIEVRWEVLTKEQVRCVLPWIPPQTIAIYSQEKPGYLENVGFLFQQMDLYLQSLGLGSCWLGMGSTDEKAPEGMKFVIMLTFGYPDGGALRCDAGEFKRKPMSHISDAPDPRLEPARLAPSAVNSQPWYFTHEAERIHVWRRRKSIRLVMDYMNQIDMGIALAHLYLAHPDTFRIYRVDDPPFIGHSYTATIEL